MELELKFDRSDRRYRAGDVVRCTFHMKLSKELRTRFISMRFLGIGTTEFETYDLNKKGCHKSIQVHTFGGYEEYFRHYKYFVGAKGALETSLAPGDYEYTESYELPPTLPVTYTGDHGSIKYLVRVKIDNNWTSDKLIAESFVVEPDYGRNVCVDRHNPVVSSEEIIFQSYLLKRKFKPLDIIASSSRSIFALNEIINLHLSVDNKSDVRLKHFLIKLEECVTFIGRKNEATHSIDASGPGNNTSTSITLNETNVTATDSDKPEETTSNRVLWERKFPLKVGKRCIENFVVEVPLKEDFKFKDLTGSKLMRAEYFVRIVGVVNRFHVDPQVIVKIQVDPTLKPMKDK